MAANSTVIYLPPPSPEGERAPGCTFAVGGFEESSIIGRVCAEFFNSGMEATFNDFLGEYAGEFEDDGEHKLVYTEIYNEFAEKVEGLLVEVLDGEGCSVEEFYAEVKEAESTGDDSESLFWLKVMITALDYQSFVDMMRERCAAARSP